MSLHIFMVISEGGGGGLMCVFRFLSHSLCFGSTKSHSGINFCGQILVKNVKTGSFYLNAGRVQPQSILF